MATPRILLIGGNFYPEPTGIGKYSGEMIDWLTRQGYDCTVVTTYPYYPQWQVQPSHEKRRFTYTKEILVTEPGSRNHFRVYRCPHYVPRRPSGRNRILSDLSFSFSSLFMLLHLLFKKRYDIVITIAPPFHLGLLGVLYKRVHKAKLIYHIQDLQIEAARDLGMIRSKLLLRCLLGLERYILQEADWVSSICDGMIRKISAKVSKDILYFPNWSNIDLFYPLPDKRSLKEQFGFDPAHKLILYSGAIGEKQGLHGLIEAARALEHRDDIRFIICGSGPYREKLEEMAADLDNVDFLPLQPLNRFNEFLNMADVHLVLQKACASDLLMPSKMTNILAVGGLSIVTAEPCSSLYDTVEKNRIGLLTPSEDTPALVTAIETALSGDHADIRKNARHYAERFLSIDGILKRYFGLILYETSNTLIKQIFKTNTKA